MGRWVGQLEVDQYIRHVKAPFRLTIAHILAWKLLDTIPGMPEKIPHFTTTTTTHVPAVDIQLSYHELHNLTGKS